MRFKAFFKSYPYVATCQIEINMSYRLRFLNNLFYPLSGAIPGLPLDLWLFSILPERSLVISDPELSLVTLSTSGYPSIQSDPWLPAILWIFSIFGYQLTLCYSMIHILPERSSGYPLIFCYSFYDFGLPRCIID